MATATSKRRQLDELKLRPTTAELRQLLSDGLKYAEIADKYSVSENTVKSWVRRAGLATRRPRYKDTIPWSNIPARHHGLYPQRMLWLLGRRLHGFDISREEASKLDTFLRDLWNGGDPSYVVAYARWLPKGFVVVEGEWINGKIPVRVEEIPPPAPGIGGRHKRFTKVSDITKVDE